MAIKRLTISGTLLTAAMATLLWLPAASAEIYQWTDEQGRKHFSQTPPPSGQQYSRKELKTTPPSDPAAARARLDRLLEQRKQLQASKQQQSEEAQRQASEAKQRQRRCASVRKHLQQLELRHRILLRNTDGSVTRLSEEERQQRIAQARAQLKEFCD